MPDCTYSTQPTHIDNIRTGDTVLHNGELKTVSRNNIKSCLFMGTTLWGDSYMSGYKPVHKVVFNTPKTPLAA